MKVIIDRFEGNFAICEADDKRMIDIERDKIPYGAREGDVLIADGDNFKLDQDTTAKRKDRINKLMDALWE